MSSHRYLRAVLGITMLVLAGPVPGAGAAPTVTLSTGAQQGSPEIAVDPTGTGHVVWKEGIDAGADALHYCRLPRGAGACADRKTFTLPKEGFGRPRVVIGPAGMAILQYRCCGEGSDGTWAVVSTDGGGTFGTPVKIGQGAPSGDAVFGPGDFSVSYISSVVTAGTLYSTAPLDGTRAEAEPVNFDETGGAANKAYHGSIGFVTPTQPIVAYGDLKNTFYRAWTGAGSINDRSTWSPEAQIPDLDEPRLASGPRGVFLMGNPENDVVYDYNIRRLEPGGAFGPPQALTLPDDSSIFGDVFQDAGGNVHAVWNANSKSQFIRRVSTDGKVFRAREVLGSTEGASFNPQIGAAADGGGWIVHDNNGSPPIRATVIPPVAAGGGGATPGAGCPDQVSLGGGKVVVKAITGCLKKQKDGTYRTDDPVRVNGIDVGAQGATTASVARSARARGLRGVAVARGAASASASVEVDPKDGTIKAEGKAETKLGSVVLDKGGFTWNVKSGGLGVAATFTDLSKFSAPPILGFSLTGKAELKFTPKGVEVRVNLKLPSPLNKVTADTTLRGSLADGLKLAGLKIAVKDVFIGAVRVKSLVADYKADPSIFIGSAQFLLPPTYGDRDEARIRFTFQEGKLKEAVAERIPFNPAYPIAPPFASLTAIGFGVRTDPLTLLGGAEIAAGAVINGRAAAKINALPPQGFKLSFGDPVTFRFDGTLEVVEFEIGDGFIEYRVPAFISFGGGANYALPGGIAGAKIGVEKDPPAFIDLKTGRFNAEVVGQVCVPAGCVTRPDNPAAGVPSLIVGGKGAISSNGVAVCGDLLLVSIGFGYHWGKSADVFGDLGGCDVSAYTATAAAASRSFRQAGVGTVNVKAGAKQANIAVRGDGAAPAVRVTAPDGATFDVTPSAPVLQTQRAVAIANQQAKMSVFYLAKPVAGAYKVEQLPGPPIAEARVAQGLPDVRVSGRVARRRDGGRGRTLAYSLRSILGQVVSFSEIGAGTGASLIGTAKGSKGTLRFTPADGRGGRRKIVALVEQDGKPRERITVATYTAPGPVRPGRPRFARLRRSGSKVVVTWGPAANATSYAVTATLNDGRRQLFVVGRRVRRLTVPAVSGQFSGKITVAGLRGSPKGGPARTATLRAVKKKRATRRR